jgi:hypothetical protein|tara:strand:+ start:215 stop:667 length:453 start_codon:yes stop_codon:yes gene_type:complete
MGLFGSIFGSFSKSKKLSKLQNIIWGDLGTLGPSGFEAMQESQKAKEKALQEYWGLCEADEGVAQLMKEHSLSRKNLNDLYMKLIKTGVGQWIKGHFVALSALAYYETFYYLLESQKRGRVDGEDFKEVAHDILCFFRGDIKNGELCNRI